jgi:hypothetical protein
MTCRQVALALVVVVVGIAAFGNRPAGYLAALSARPAPPRP